MKVFSVGLASLALATAIGAFGAHALRDRLAPDLLAVFQTGHQYHASGSIVLMLLGVAEVLLAGSKMRPGIWAFGAGMGVFSGSLYALALTGVRTWGAVTPIGGVLMIGGALALSIVAWRGKRP